MSSPMATDTAEVESHGPRWVSAVGLGAVAVLVAGIGFAIAVAQRPRGTVAPPALVLPSETLAPIPTPVPNGPIAGLGVSIADDPATNRVVLFGGVSSSDKTWLWDGRQWTPDSPRSSPPTRSGAAIAYDPATRLVMLFGGEALDGRTQFNDTWAWSGTTWALLDKGGPDGPFAGVGGDMTWDAAQGEMLLVTTGGTLTDCETWVWDGSRWSRKADENLAAVVVDATVAYDSETRTVVLVAPSSTNYAQSATFGWTGSSWHLLLADGPELYGLAEDPQLDGVIGCGSPTSSVTFALQADCWEWASWRWYQLQAAVRAGPATTVTVASEVDDVDHNQLLIMGWFVAPAANDAQPLYVWAWDGVRWTLSS